MITNKQKCIAEQAVYGDLMCQTRCDNINYLFMFMYKSTCTLLNPELCGSFKDKLSGIRLILRPLSDLTKPITHKGYNNDQPFVPVIEILKEIYSDRLDDCSVKDISVIDGYATITYTDSEYMPYVYHHDLADFFKDEMDFLNLWHFDTRGLLESGEAISTELHDVYSVVPPP